MPPLSILIWLPALAGVLGALTGALGARNPSTPALADGAETGQERAGGRWGVPGVLALIGTLGALGLAIGYIADYSGAAGHGLQHVTDVVWISELGIHY